jgi:hypothetical protein
MLKDYILDYKEFMAANRNILKRKMVYKPQQIMTMAKRLT